MNPETAERCGGCGEPLASPCPRCKTVNPSALTACTKCGFSVGAGFTLRRLQLDADLSIARGDLAKAAALLNEADVLWCDNEQTRTLRIRIKHAQAEETKTLDGVRNADASRQLFEAPADGAG